MVAKQNQLWGEYWLVIKSIITIALRQTADMKRQVWHRGVLWDVATAVRNQTRIDVLIWRLATTKRWIFCVWHTLVLECFSESTRLRCCKSNGIQHQIVLVSLFDAGNVFDWIANIATNHTNTECKLRDTAYYCKFAQCFERSLGRTYRQRNAHYLASTGDKWFANLFFQWHMNNINTFLRVGCKQHQTTIGLTTASKLT